MNERRKIEDRIKKKEEEIQELESQTRDARVYVKALQDVLKMLPRDADAPHETVAAALRTGSSVSAARDIILKIGRPVHIMHLLREMGKVATRESRASLGSSLAAYVRKGEIFTRPAPNEFGLVELGHMPEEVNKTQLPEDFGEIENA